MWTYMAPVRDMRFVVEDVLHARAWWRSTEAFADLDEAVVGAVLDEAAKFASGVLAPINAGGDREGCHLDGGEVRTPAGYRDAYRAFVAAGWPALSCAPAWGGQGLPQLVRAAVTEMFNAANPAWNMYPGLLDGAYRCLLAHGSEELKARYLPAIVRGEALSTMALTESQAGSDLGLLRARAVPQADGSCRVTGSKIFISGGEHDLTDNIVHLVLARMPDAPPGTKGLSLVLVPKRLPGGQRNAVACAGIEHKMGIHGSATCVMNFDAATGWLIGGPHRGLEAMFVMMNSARLLVALQGLGHLDAAAQNARAYAAERRQARAPVRPPGEAHTADLIVGHPAIRRVLLDQRALVAGMRVLAYHTAMLLDCAEHEGAPDSRRAADQVALLTPVLKAFMTAQGHAGATACLQVFGGYGYLRDYGIEQTVRDSRIAMIYEGTNEVQAIDLVARKVLADEGRRMFALCESLRADAACIAEATDGDTFARALGEALDWQQRATASVVAAAPGDAELPFRVADDYLHATAYTLLAWAWGRIHAAAVRASDPVHAEQRALAAHGIGWVLPRALAYRALVERGLTQPLGIAAANPD